MNNKQAFIDAMTRKLDYLKEAFTKATVKFAKDPANFFDWADGPMEMAAEMEIVGHILEAFEKNEALTVAQVQKGWTERALNVARYPKRSTSVPSVLMQTYRGAKYVELAEAAGAFLEEEVLA